VGRPAWQFDTISKTKIRTLAISLRWTPRVSRTRFECAGKQRRRRNRVFSSTRSSHLARIERSKTDLLLSFSGPHANPPRAASACPLFLSARLAPASNLRRVDFTRRSPQIGTPPLSSPPRAHTGANPILIRTQDLAKPEGGDGACEG
jgi:hypothetical protein